METPHPPHGDTNPGPQPEVHDALARAVEHASALPASGAVRDVLAEILSRAIIAFTETIAVARPAADTEPGSGAEALAVVAGIDQLRSSLAALDSTWQVTAEQRIRQADAARNVPEKNQGHAVPSELALARRVSPHSSSLSLSSARRLVGHMPATLGHLSTGLISERTAQAIARTLDGSDPAVCAEVDDWIAENLTRLDGLGTRRTCQLVRELSQQADPSESRARAERAARARNVSMQPVGDGMARITAVLRALDATAVMKTLDSAAASQKAAGARYSHQALQADNLVALVLGGAQQAVMASSPSSDAAGVPGPIPVVTADTGCASAAGMHGSAPSLCHEPRMRLDVGVIITDRALLCPESDGEIARIEGYGPIPAHIVVDTMNGSPPGMLTAPRADDEPPPPSPQPPPEAEVQPPPDTPADDDWGDIDSMENATPVEQHPDVEVTAIFRRLYTHPRTGELVAMESRARAFPAGLKRMITWRDETCRTPWCNARIRHIDHIVSVASGGPTNYDNGQGLCERCNYLKEHGPWHLTPAMTAEPSGQITWESPHGARGASPTPHSESPRPGARRPTDDPTDPGEPPGPAIDPPGPDESSAGPDD